MKMILPLAALALLATIGAASAQTTTVQTTTTSMPTRGSGASMNGLNMGSSSMSTSSMAGMGRMGFRRADMAFVRTATFGNTFEITAARLALQDSKNPQVRAFAQRMIRDHTNLGNAMKAAVHRADPSFTLPAGLTTTQERLIGNLRRSRSFDAVYKADMIKSHTQTYDLFRQYARGGHDNAAVRSVVQQYTPVVKSHLNSAFQLLHS